MKEINRYRLSLVQYYLSYVFPKWVFLTDKGFCYHFKEGLYYLPILESLEPEKCYNGYWYIKGHLKPRIKILKQTIKLCKNN